MTKIYSRLSILIVFILILFAIQIASGIAQTNLAMVGLMRHIVRQEAYMFTIQLDTTKQAGAKYISYMEQLEKLNVLQRYHLAQVYFWSGNKNETIRILDSDHENVSFPLSNILLGYALWQTGDSNRASQIWGQIQNSENFMRRWAFIAETEQEYETMEIIYQQLVSMHPEDTTAQAGNWYARCNNLINRGNTSQELGECVQKVGQLNSQNYGRLLDLGKILVDNKQYNLADSLLQRAVLLEGEDTYWAKYYLGLAYYYQEQLVLAKDALISVVQIAPGFGRGHQWLARTLVKMGNLEDAKSHYESALELLPGNELLIKEYENSTKNQLR